MTGKVAVFRCRIVGIFKAEEAVIGITLLILTVAALAVAAYFRLVKQDVLNIPYKNVGTVYAERPRICVVFIFIVGCLYGVANLSFKLSVFHRYGLVVNSEYFYLCEVMSFTGRNPVPLILKTVVDKLVLRLEIKDSGGILVESSV